MIDGGKNPSPRKKELLEKSYRYVLQHGLIDMSLRPLAEAIGSSPRVLLFLFGSKDGLVRELLARAREAELAMLQTIAQQGDDDLAEAASWLWQWLSDAKHRDLLYLWVEAYGRSLTTPQGPWGGFAESTVRDWLQVLQEHQPEHFRSTTAVPSNAPEFLRCCAGHCLTCSPPETPLGSRPPSRMSWRRLGPPAPGIE